MPEKFRELSPPTGLMRWFFRMPITLYRMNLGWLMGKRMLLLNHVGRKSGLPRKAVLEVANYDKETGSYIVNVGFGKTSDWYQNIKKQPDVSIQVGAKKMDVHAHFLSPEEGGEIMLAFAKKHPLEAKLSGILGYKVDGSDEDWKAMGGDMQFVRLSPR